MKIFVIWFLGSVHLEIRIRYAVIDVAVNIRAMWGTLGIRREIAREI